MLPLAPDEAIRIYKRRALPTEPLSAEDRALLEQLGVPIGEMLAGAATAARIEAPSPRQAYYLVAAERPTAKDLRIAHDDLEALSARLPKRATPRRNHPRANERRAERRRARSPRLGKRKADPDVVRAFVESLDPGAKVAEEVAAKYDVHRSTAFRWLTLIRTRRR